MIESTDIRKLDTLYVSCAAADSASESVNAAPMDCDASFGTNTFSCSSVKRIVTGAQMSQGSILEDASPKKPRHSEMAKEARIQDTVRSLALDTCTKTDV